MDVILSGATSKLVGTLSIGQWTIRISRPARAATGGRSMRCHAPVAQPINATMSPLDSSRARQQNQHEMHRGLAVRASSRGICGFVGVDGPRWFLRALFTGVAATDPALAGVLEDAVRNIVVVRGSSPMPVRDPLPLVLPKEVAEQVEQSGGAHAAPDEVDIPSPEPIEEEPAQPRRPSGRRRRR
jgi:hypothetical protein